MATPEILHSPKSELEKEEKTWFGVHCPDCGFETKIAAADPDEAERLTEKAHLRHGRHFLDPERRPAIFPIENPRNEN